ncbi:hypothetical protein KHQ08_08450 [Pseudochrobactrum algeriensis]|uniref:hypothetical protein n=1 Tax=Pseudochrobactrum algeriensis TaxID=2834768 RepID=UPI001BCEFA03|nr:hypothetical protein [Pseudochrobactrum algeriensis]MBX8811404.1 hypothetical protein [Ochrobactrum sp. MR34]QVQ38009.1 hypothetical protein KHQ08_08450 [Pseudochrobactrum algeriensis]QVQ41231.1 hypothetical protein KHQ07_06745 [Pseudochrobactrum algeriensis]QVQ45155.1 hypothetical protein KHQ09_08710 [Pseudochrobactrum algeriensis]
MKKFALFAALGLTPLLLAAALFTGIEVKYREHDTDYTFFVKQQPSLQLFFVNPIVCGECDVEAFEKLSLARIDDIRTYCRQRFGLDNLRMCHAIFAESQRQANSRMQNPDEIAAVAARFINHQNIEQNSNWAFPVVNTKVAVPECLLPLDTTWRDDADQAKRISVSCADTGRPVPQDRWNVTLPIYPN